MISKGWPDMLFPLFDENCELVAWIRPEEHIFDTGMDWVAYISHGHAWSAETGNWCGPVHGMLCLDTSGRVVAWNPQEHVAGTARPDRPARAARAARPARPARPVGGWSDLSFEEWVEQ